MKLTEAEEQEREFQEAHGPAMARSAKCRECPLANCGEGPVPSVVKPNARLVIVGEAPGAMEVRLGENFVGPSGRILNLALEAGGLERSDCSILNAQMCRPPGGDLDAYTKLLKHNHAKALALFREEKGPDPGPLVLPQDACYPRLEKDLKESGSKFFLAVGGQGLKSLAKYLGLPYGKQLKVKPEKKPKAGKVKSEAKKPAKSRRAKKNTPDVEEILVVNGQPVRPELQPTKPSRKRAETEKVPVELLPPGQPPIPPQPAIKPLPVVKGIAQQQGHPITLPDGRVLLSSYHPAFAMREGSKHFMPEVRRMLTRAATIAVRGYVDWFVPKGLIFPTVKQIEDTCALFIKHKVEVTSDIETDGINARTCKLRCVGLAAVVGGKEIGIVIPFRRKDGVEWWPDVQDKIRVVRATKAVLNSCEINGHNFNAYDALVLTRLGLITDRNRSFEDTLILDKNSDSCDLPHKLEAVAGRYLEIPTWKISHNTDEKFEGDVQGVDDYSYHEYCVNDCFATLRILPKLRARVAECASTKQHQIDLKLAPILRNAGNLGACYDIRRRTNIATILTAEIIRRDRIVTDIYRKITGKEKFNVRSNPQVADLLFNIKGLIPVVNTKNKPWKEGDSKSAGSPGLMKLIDHGVDDETKEFIEALLRYRALEKQASVYSGKIAQEDHAKGLYKKGDLINGLPIHWEETDYGVLPTLHWTYKLTIPSGRLAAQPSIQVIPESSRLLPCYECNGTGEFKSYTCQICYDKERKKVRYCGLCGDSRNKECIGCAGDGKTRAVLNMRAMFTAFPDHMLVGADYDALEIRLITGVVQDKEFLDVLNNDRDVHIWNYACFEGSNRREIQAIYDSLQARGGKNNKEVKQLRNIAKSFSFSCAYGAAPDKIFQTMSTMRNKTTGELEFKGITIEKCRKWHKNFLRQHPEIVDWQQRVKRETEILGYTMSMIHGRKRFFPGGSDPNAAINGRIQSSGADCANDATIAIAERIPFGGWSKYTGFVYQIHDCLIANVPEDRVMETRQIFKECMRHKLGGVDITATPASGFYWSEI